MSLGRSVLKVGGVPEHFNWPWRRALKVCSSFSWSEYKGGSGAMASDLKSGELDVAVMLTEALVAECGKGAPLKIWGAYTATPLVWGVHAKKGFQGKPRSFAVSRFGSGSHLMALVDAQMRGAPLPTDFVVVQSLEGARESLGTGKADAFMWEKFTTKFLVDSGEWDRIAEVPTPWPCFSVAVRNGTDLSLVNEVLGAVRKEAETMVDNERDLVADVAREYNQQEVDVAQWIKTVRWCIRPQMPLATVAFVKDSLTNAGVLSNEKNSDIDVSAMLSTATDGQVTTLDSVGTSLSG